MVCGSMTVGKCVASSRLYDKCCLQPNGGQGTRRRGVAIGQTIETMQLWKSVEKLNKKCDGAVRAV